MRLTVNTKTESHLGPWRTYTCTCGCEDVHVVPGFEGRKHTLTAQCWCHPSVQLQEHGDMFVHNVAQ